MYRRNALMPRAKMTMVLVTLWGWSTWPISMGWTPATVPGFSYLTLTVNGIRLRVRVNPSPSLT